MTVTIAGVEYSAADSYSIRQQAGSASTSDIDILVGAGQEVPLSLSSCVIEDDSGTLFSGIVESVQSPSFRGGKEVKRYRLTLTSFERIFQNRVISDAFENKYTHEIVQSLFDSYISSEGITLGAISESVQQYKNFNYSFSKLSDILEELADDINASYYVSPDKKFYFVTRDAFTLVDMPEGVTGLQIDDDSGDVRTVQIVTGASEETSAQTEQTFWLENQSAWVLGYQISSVTGFTIEGIIAGFGLKGVDEGDTDVTFLYEPGSNSVTVNTNATTKPATGDNVVIVYKGYYDIVVTNSNDALKESIAHLSGTSGLIEEVYTDETIDNYQDAETKANSLLQQYGERQKEISCSCRDFENTEIFTMWKINRPDINIVGQYVVTERTISAFGPDEYWIQCKLKNKGYFSRYGQSLKTVSKSRNATTKVYKNAVIGESISAVDSVTFDHAGLVCYPVGATGGNIFDTGLPGFYPMGCC